MKHCKRGSWSVDFYWNCGLTAQRTDIFMIQTPLGGLYCQQKSTVLIVFFSFSAFCVMLTALWCRYYLLFICWVWKFVYIPCMWISLKCLSVYLLCLSVSTVVCDNGLNVCVNIANLWPFNTGNYSVKREIFSFCFFFCLFVCLLTRILKKLWMNCLRNFWKVYSLGQRTVSWILRVICFLM